MSLFASAGKSNKQLGVRIKQVRSVLEHIGLYVGLAVYTAAGAKVFFICVPRYLSSEI
jgi:ABC-type cobalamin transport system permease subunit